MQNLNNNSMARATFLAALGLWLLTGVAPAQTNAAKPTLPPNRFLFVVDTSKAMERRSEGTIRALQDLLLSGVNGQLRHGDSVGIWTFNDDLHAGEFPVQRWTAQAQNNIAQSAVSFIKAQKFEKEGSLANVLPQMQRLIKGSEFITVIIISQGTEKIAGTPFDDRINEYYRVWQNEQHNARMPFQTLLRAKKGHITDYAVSAFPWPLDVPALPQELLVARETPKTQPKKTAPPIGQPLIVSGRKPPVPATQAQTAPIAPEISKPNAGSASTAPAAALPAKGLEPSTLVQTSPAVTTSPPEITQTPSALAKSDTTQTAPSAPASLPPSASGPAAPAAGESAPKQADQPASVAVSRSPPSSNAPPRVAPAPAASHIEGEMTPPANSILSQRTVIVIGTVVLLIAAGLTVVMLRRPRPSSATSLITRSFDREHKPEASEHPQEKEP